MKPTKQGKSRRAKDKPGTDMGYLVPGQRICHKHEWLIPNLASPLALERWYCVDRIGWARCVPGHYLGRGEGDTLLLHFVVKGELEHKIRNRWYAVGAGEACLIDMTEPTSQRNRGKKQAEIYWVSFYGPDLTWWIETLKAQSHPVFRGVDRVATLRLFKDIVRMTEERRVGYEPRVSMLLGGLLAELYAVREYGNPLLAWGRDGGALSPGILSAMHILYIEHSIPQSVKNAADYAKMSPGRFAHRFREEVGQSPMAWLNQFRLQRARILLATTQRPVAEIARSVGLPDPAHFSRLFRRETGLSPRQYRQRPVGV